MVEPLNHGMYGRCWACGGQADHTIYATAREGYHDRWWLCKACYRDFRIQMQHFTRVRTRRTAQEGK